MGVSIDNKGYYEDQEWGRQELSYLFIYDSQKILQMPTTTSIVVKILRNGKVQTKQILLEVYKQKGERILVYGHAASQFLIEHGLLFLELSLPFVETT